MSNGVLKVVAFVLFVKRGEGPRGELEGIR